MILASYIPSSISTTQPSSCLLREEVNKALAIPDLWQFTLETDAVGSLSQGDFIGKLSLGQGI
jgi:hypothetical protein